MRRASSLVVLLLLALALPGRAEMAESLRREFHRYAELGVVVLTDSSLRDLDSVLAAPGTRVLVVQASPEAFTPPLAARVMEWVRAGHTAWFYDARLAPLFGMKPYMLQPDQFRGRPEEGQIGDGKRMGLATVVLATGPHEVLTGVGQATIWLPEFEPGRYGSVLVEGDTVPLLQFAPDSPALAALRRDGRGLVAFKPLLWTVPLSGERFQANLLEFSAGYQVPGSGGEGRFGNPPGPTAAWVEGRPAPFTPAEGTPAPPIPESLPPLPGGRVVASPLPPSPTPTPSAAAPSPTPSPAATPAEPFPDRLEVSGEPPFQGRVLNLELRFETSGESLRLPCQQVSWLTVGTPLDLDRLETREGRRLAGFLMLEELQVATPSGVRTLGKRQLQRVDFSAR